ncbi:Aste57867_14118 [Aphanomyces stellatus]|uniref:Aste57867_14118 protein n=1 Tax=Aphanomyces stellatus TaxID=120398 RepID=A0A485L239_9STRA|nr:hypothetical protein As57867_014067 [Aphanomyces stellatus]VFT90945.1 Aste57867_14118 [Aphanomyces stellatus]
MPRVHARDGSPTARRVRVSTTSLIWTVGFVLNLVLMPFKAYMSEPLPWTIEPPALNYTPTDSFDALSRTVFDYLSSEYNNKTLPASTIFTRDVTTNTYLLRYTLALPLDGERACATYMFSLPGSAAYSQGVSTFVCDFLAQNTTARMAQTRYHCQIDTVAAWSVGVCCTWMEEMSELGADTFEVYHSSLSFESHQVSLAKFMSRACLSLFVLYILWHRYYRLYQPLLYNLRTIGLNDDANRYVVHMGDPTWLILSHPFVSLAMVVDILINSLYGGTAVFRTSQLDDMFQFFLGGLYGSRMVWAAYMAMRYLNPLIERMKWEHRFQPVDAGLMAITASVYAGPLLYLVSRTSINWVFQWTGSLVVPPATAAQYYHTASSILLILCTMACVPVVHSLTLQWAQSCCTHHKTRNYSHTDFNDWKQRFMFRCLRRQWHECAVVDGGVLYYLFDANPRYKKFPLFSPRGADCFVSCLNAAGVVQRQVRLSLIFALDMHTKDPTSATCPTARAVCVIGDRVCDETKNALPSDKCIHLGANGCLWI